MYNCSRLIKSIRLWYSINDRKRGDCWPRSFGRKLFLRLIFLHSIFSRLHCYCRPVKLGAIQKKKKLHKNHSSLPLTGFILVDLIWVFLLFNDSTVLTYFFISHTSLKGVLSLFGNMHALYKYIKAAIVLPLVLTLIHQIGS